MGLKGRDVVSILDLTRGELETLFETADKFDRRGRARYRLLEDKVLALAFFEPSTRTRLSFETAMKRLGGETIGFAGAEATSVAKGESLTDTIKMLDSYADAIVLRHRYEGAAKLAAEVAENPVINGGDGRQHHPTQSMIDLYTIRRLFGTIDGLNIALAGDLRYARTAASLALALTLFRPKHLYLVSPPQLTMRPEVLRVLDEAGVRYSVHGSLDDVVEELDVIYVTRIQKERFPDPMEYEKVRGSYRITLDLLKKGRKGLKVLHPLPKVDEIELAVDHSEYAAYFQQAAWGVPVRMALLTHIFGVEV